MITPEIQKKIDSIVDRCGYEIKHFPELKQKDIDHWSRRCAEEGYNLASEDIQNELSEQCRINGIGAQRELKLETEIKQLREAIEHWKVEEIDWNNEIAAVKMRKTLVGADRDFLINKNTLLTEKLKIAECGLDGVLNSNFMGLCLSDQQKIQAYKLYAQDALNAIQKLTADDTEEDKLKCVETELFKQLNPHLQKDSAWKSLPQDIADNIIYDRKPTDDAGKEDEV